MNFVICTNYNRFKKGHTRISSGGNTIDVHTVLMREGPRKDGHLEQSVEYRKQIFIWKWAEIKEG